MPVYPLELTCRGQTKNETNNSRALLQIKN